LTRGGGGGALDFSSSIALRSDNGSPVGTDDREVDFAGACVLELPSCAVTSVGREVMQQPIVAATNKAFFIG
jgi:hypothetical protein